jgi:mRNA interferase RelE/StbE
MIVEFDKSFEKSLERVKDKSVFPRVEKLIILLEAAHSMTAVPGIKKA